MKITLITLLVFFVSLASFLWWASNSDITPGIKKYDFVNGNSLELKSVNDLKIMTWNVGYAYGLGSEGTDYNEKSKEEYLIRLKKISQVINEANPDILLVQEIDFDSKRSAFINQVKFIAENTELKNYAYLSSWDLNYVPFPYVPINNHFAKVDCGGVVFSKYQITEHISQIYSKPKSNPWWYNLFYLHRYTQMVKIGPLRVFNSHLEAFDQVDRQQQVQNIINWVDRFKRDLVVLGGDHNTLPFYESTRSGFDGYPDDEYAQDQSHLSIKNGLVWLTDIISQDEYTKNRNDWLTFPSDEPDRKLDYIYVGKKLGGSKSYVIDDQLSDHRPMITTINLSNAND